jgi:hypothetical protein
MPRSWQEIYAEIARLPAPARLRLLARLLADLAAETESAASARPTEAPPTSGAPATSGATGRLPRTRRAAQRLRQEPPGRRQDSRFPAPRSRSAPRQAPGRASW